MKTLNIYVTKSFLVTFVMSIGILTFGMMGARIVKDVFDYISRGIPVSVAFMFLLYISPLVFTLSIPWAALVTIMLVFGRMSADSEITAMRACGISILQIISPIIIIIFILTCLCLYLKLEVEPVCTYRARAMVTKAIDHPMSILVPGRPVIYENYHIYIGDKVGENGIKDIQVFVMDKNGEVEQDITAVNGKIQTDKEKQFLDIILYNALVVGRSSVSHSGRVFSKQMTFSIDYGNNFNKVKIGKEVNYLSFKEIFGRIVLDRRRGIDTTRVEVELNQRIALALSPIAFMLLGMPLAIRTSRRETSVGLFLSVALAGVYFSLVMVCDALTAYPQYHPQVLLWIPNVIFQIFGVVFIFRIARR